MALARSRFAEVSPSREVRLRSSDAPTEVCPPPARPLVVKPNEGTLIVIVMGCIHTIGPSGPACCSVRTGRGRWSARKSHEWAARRNGGARILTEIGDVNRFPTPSSSPLRGRPSHPPVRQLIRSEQRSPTRQPAASAFCSLRNERSSPTTAANEARATSTAPPSSVSPTGAATHPQAAPNGLAYGDYSGRQSPPAAETVEIAA
jgi:hypothetical protein